MVVEFIFRWAHVLFGLVWVGSLYYFNFVQTGYFKEAEASARADAVKKLAPRALWWQRFLCLYRNTSVTGGQRGGGQDRPDDQHRRGDSLQHWSHRGVVGPVGIPVSC